MGVIRNTINWALGRTLVQSAGMSIMRRSAEYCAARARLWAPVDTGYLRDSISVERGEAPGSWQVIVTAPYAVFVELGHLDGLHGRGWIPPNPFLRNAIADTVLAFPSIAADTELADAVWIRRPLAVSPGRQRPFSAADGDVRLIPDGDGQFIRRRPP